MVLILFQEQINEKKTSPEMKNNGKKNSKKSFKSPEPASSSTISSRRRSVRFKEEEKKQTSNIATEQESSETSKANDLERSDSKISNGNSVSSLDKSEQLKDKPSKSKFGDDKKDVDSSDVEKNYIKETENNKVTEQHQITDFKDSHDTISSGDKAKSQDKSTSESENVSLLGQSIPQNVLGVIGFTPESSSKSVESKTETSRTDESDLIGTDQSDESQPLFSWTQKLNQLNKSPRNQSPLKKILSQDLRSSPQKTRSQSPAKSPKRNKKKQGTENFGNLDQWIIRSPGKKTDVQDENTENVINVCSATIVEETQSPSKFSKDKLEGDTKTNSVMETPPKYNFSHSTIIGFGSSNRKLFQSSQDNIENIHDIVEDSNIVPGSPNSKSFTTCVKTGTPVLKLTRLTDSEIKKYSPSKEDKKELDMTPTKSSPSQLKHKTKNVKTVIDLGGNEIVNKSSKCLHKHDDFSAFKPLGNDNQNNSEIDKFFSKSLTDTEQAMLKLGEDEKSIESDTEKMDISQSDSELIEGSQSLSGSAESVEINGLFSQIVKEAKLEVEQAKLEKSFEPSADIFTQDFDVASSEPVISQAENEPQQAVEENQSVLESESGTRNRKRKQETPKKTTPENVKKNKKKKVENSQSPEIGSAKKVSKRLQEKREKKEMEKQSGSPTDTKKSDKKTKNNKKKDDSAENEKCSQEENKIGKKILGKTSRVFNSWDSDRQKSFSDQDASKKSDAKKETVVKDNESISASEAKNQIERTCDTESIKTWKEVTVDNTDTVERIEIVSEKLKKESEVSNKNKMEDNGHENSVVTCSLDDSRNIGVSDKETASKQNDESQKKETSSSQEPLQVIGQKTPESRNSSAQPERKSTTKKKKAVAQKRVLKRERKDVVVNESDSNLDLDLSDDDDLPLSETKKVIAENLEKKIEQLGVKEKAVTKADEKESDTEKPIELKVTEYSKQNEVLNEKEEEKCGKTEGTETVDEALDVSFASDDDIPLSSIKTSQEKLNSNKEIKSKEKHSKKEKSTEKHSDKINSYEKTIKNKNRNVSSDQRKQKQNITSPKTNKLRSGIIVKTRLRSGEKKTVTSPNSKKLSLAVKRVHNARKKLNVGAKRKQEVVIDIAEIEKDACVDNEFNSKKLDSTIKNNEKDSRKVETVVTVENTDVVKEKDTSVHSDETEILPLNSNQAKDFAGMKDASTYMADRSSRPINRIFEILDETPTKGKESINHSATSLLMRNSDSKLILGSRKFEKRSGFARRSILKPSSLRSVSDVSSPKRDFHPIKVARIYSPTASPSASILKKRRLSDDTTSDTNSPPAKVSYFVVFNDLCCTTFASAIFNC